MLSSKQITDFYDRGYMLVKKVFCEQEIDEMSYAINRLRHRAVGMEGEVYQKDSKFVVQNGLLERVVWAGAAEPRLLQYGRDKRLTAVVAQLLETTHAEHLINQVHLKFSGGGFYRWHQDSTHRGYGTSDWKDVNSKGSYVQIVTAIDEATEKNGPLMVIPYSGKKGHLYLPYDKTKQTVSDAFNPADAIQVLMEPGDVLFFGPYLIHGSEVNTSNLSRRIFINGFAYPGANKKKYPGDGAGELIKLV